MDNEFTRYTKADWPALYIKQNSYSISAITGYIGKMSICENANKTGIDKSFKVFNSVLNTKAFENDSDLVISEAFLSSENIANDLYSLTDNEIIVCETETYSYLFCQDMFYVHCYCYKKEWLHQHVDNAKKGIRFIKSDYTTLFTIPDGENITTVDENHTFNVYSCRYLNDTHVEIAGNVYHICEFAEIIEKNGKSISPSLPSKRTLINLRKAYPKGERVTLIEFHDSNPGNLFIGDVGTVTSVDDMGTIHVSWDCGSTLGVAYGIDVCKKIH